MSANNRLPFAKRAIHTLIDRLEPLDRLAVVAFDSAADVISPLAVLSEEGKAALRAKIDGIAPGSGTNISQGMQLGGDLLSLSAGERAQKVILLSDGEANEGIIDPQQLARLASSVNRRAASFSTIGMGLGFNEQLMASLADWGGGSFSYLEHLEALGTILDKNLNDARRLYASMSTIEMRLPEQVRLIDAAGYPIEKTDNGVAIPFGELLAGSKKSAILTLELPTDSVRTQSLGAISVRFKDSSGEHVVGLPADVMNVSVVDHQRKAEVTRSINNDLYRESWLTNNLGSLKQSVQKALSRGDTLGAGASIAAYEKQLQGAADAAGMDLANLKVKEQISQMRGELREASEGSEAEQEEKRNRLRKKLLYDGQSHQRSSNY
jgi:Ca-activated chloride channel family protein